MTGRVIYFFPFLLAVKPTIKEISDITNIENIIIKDMDSYVFIPHHLPSLVNGGSDHTISIFLGFFINFTSSNKKTGIVIT